MSDWPGNIKPACSLSNTADQNLASTTQFISFGTETFKTHTAMHSTSATATALTGTAAKTSGSGTLTGTGTAFTTELTVGDKVVVGTETLIIVGIANNTSATFVPVSHTGALSNNTQSGQTVTRDDTSRIVIQEPGIYHVWGTAWMTPTTSDVILNIFKGSGTTVTGLADQTGTGTANQARVGVQVIARFSAGDIVRLAGYQAQGGAGNSPLYAFTGSTNAAGRAPLFAVIKLSD